jgi:predicted esterase
MDNHDGSNFFNTSRYVGISDTLKYLDEYMHECTGGTGFDAIIGFSQGSIIASTLLSMNEYNFKFGILIGTYPITDVEYLHYDNIKINVLCVWGTGDTIVSPDKSLAVYEKLGCDVREKLIHEGRHIIPLSSKHKKEYINFIDKIIKK